MYLRRFQKEDLQDLIALFKDTVQAINSKDYSDEESWKAFAEREQRQAVLEIILEMRLRGIDFSAVIPETRE